MAGTMKTATMHANTSVIDGKLSLVLPAHNEEENIGPVVTRAREILPQYCRDWEIIVVNDGSKDRTGAVVAELAADDPQHLRLVTHPRNRGYGAALTSGFATASGDYIMFMDSDRQFDIGDLARLVPYVGVYDIVNGFRIKRNDPPHRLLNAWIFKVAVMILFGINLKDIDCAFKIFRADLLKGIQLTSPGALINTEIQAKAARQGASRVEVGVNHYPRVAGSPSGASLRVITRAMGEIIKLWWRMQSYQPTSPARPGMVASQRGLSLPLAALLLGVALLLLLALLGRRRAS